MEQAIRLRDVGIRFRVPRRGRRGLGIPRLLGRRRTKFWGIRHVTFDIARGEVVGLIGPNGSGKSTLLRTVSAIYRPDEGESEVSGRVAPLLTAGAGLSPGLTGWENIELSGVLLGLTRRRTNELAQTIAEFADIRDFMDAPIRVYSAGMKARLGFAIAVHADPDILALDEVISVADEEFRERSAQRLREFIDSGGTVVVASHEVESLTDLCRRFVRLEHGEVVDDGEPGEVGPRYLAEHGATRDRDAPPARRRRAPVWAPIEDR
ncbi:MAG: ATP-binding cassette domain-containing protein [Actinomycetota bacterium]